MIAALTGLLASKAPTHITVDVQGVGYEVQIPLSTYYGLPDLNQTTSLRIHTHLREDAIQLYGFLTSQEKGAFVLLTGISGIGPKLALSVLSALTVSDLVSAIRAGDVDKLVSVPGIGTKSAGRIVLELKDKVERLHPGLVRDSELASGTSSQIVDDAQSALVNLGYRTSDVSQAVKRLARSSAEPLPLKDLIRAVLKELTGGL
jgi:Holliday junction DNA helicase RuvA